MEADSNQKKEASGQPLTRDDVERLLSQVASAAELDLSGRNLQQVNLAYEDLRGAILSHANLRGANLRGARLNRADLRGADLSSADLDGADLSNARLSDESGNWTVLSQANLRHTKLQGLDLRKFDLSGLDLENADLNDTDLRGARLIGTNLCGADLSRALLHGNELVGARLVRDVGPTGWPEQMRQNKIGLRGMGADDVRLLDGPSIPLSDKQMAYVQARTVLLEQIRNTLQKDERFVAAWLSGSFGRGEQTWLSDLDLHVVIADACSESLCAAPWSEGAKTTDERLALFKQFGTPGLIFERTKHANQVGGILTNVVYQESAQSVDWMLIPQSEAYREHPSLLLFDKIGLPEAPVPEPESLEQRRGQASKHVGFFWIIATGAARALLAGRIPLFYSYLLLLEESIGSVEAALRGERAIYTKDTKQQMYTTLRECADALRRLCDEMERLMPLVVQFGGYVPDAPRAIVEMRLALAEGEQG